jgi:hypothetical protein
MQYFGGLRAVFFLGGVRGATLVSIRLGICQFAAAKEWAEVWAGKLYQTPETKKP